MGWGSDLYSRLRRLEQGIETAQRRSRQQDETLMVILQGAHGLRNKRYEPIQQPPSVPGSWACRMYSCGVPFQAGYVFETTAAYETGSGLDAVELNLTTDSDGYIWISASDLPGYIGGLIAVVEMLGPGSPYVSGSLTSYQAFPLAGNYPGIVHQAFAPAEITTHLCWNACGMPKSGTALTITDQYGTISPLAYNGTSGFYATVTRVIWSTTFTVLQPSAVNNNPRLNILVSGPSLNRTKEATVATCVLGTPYAEYDFSGTDVATAIYPTGSAVVTVSG